MGCLLGAARRALLLVSLWLAGWAYAQVCAVPQNNGASFSSAAGQTVNGYFTPNNGTYSAGSQPTGEVHPRSLALLAAEGIDASDCASKSWDALPVTPDIVITVCASAAGETCPAYLGPVLRSHWGVDDPAKATGSPADIDAAFVRAYRVLRARIALLAATRQVLRNALAVLGVSAPESMQREPAPAAAEAA